MHVHSPALMLAPMGMKHSAFSCMSAHSNVHHCSRLMHGRWEADPDAGHIREFFRLLAVCHTVIPEGPPTPTEIRYQVLFVLVIARRCTKTYRQHAVSQCLAGGGPVGGVAG